MFDQNELAQLEGVVEKVVHKVMFDEASVVKLELIVGKVIDEKVPGIVRPIVEQVVHENLVSLMEHQIMPQFDLLHERIDKVEVRLGGVEKKLDEVDGRLVRVEKKLDVQMVTKGFLQDKLDSFQIEHSMKYKPAM